MPVGAGGVSWRGWWAWRIHNVITGGRPGWRAMSLHSFLSLSCPVYPGCSICRVGLSGWWAFIYGAALVPLCRGWPLAEAGRHSLVLSGCPFCGVCAGVLVWGGRGLAVCASFPAVWLLSVSLSVGGWSVCGGFVGPGAFRGCGFVLASRLGSCFGPCPLSVAGVASLGGCLGASGGLPGLDALFRFCSILWPAFFTMNSVLCPEYRSVGKYLFRP